MSQVAAVSGSSSQPTLMSQRVHTIDSSGIGSAESALPLKSIGLSSRGDPCSLDVRNPQQQPRDGIRRSRRLVERSTKVKRESTDVASRRHPSRQNSSHYNQSSSQPPSSSAPPSSSTTTFIPSCLPANELLSVTSSTTSGIGIIPRSPHPAPELSALTRSVVTERLTSGNNQSDATSTASTQLQAGSPTQLEHSYALTFASTAEEIPLVTSQAGYLEATPHAPPLSRSHEATLHTPPPMTRSREATPHAPPISRSREATPHTPPPMTRSREATPHAAPTSGSTTTLNTQSPSAIPVSVIQTSLTRGTTRGTNLSRGNEISRSVLPPYMLSSTSTASSASNTNLEFPQNGANLHVCAPPPAMQGLSVPTEHAQNDRLRGINDEAISRSNFASSNHPHGALFEVPMPVPLVHYPVGAGVRRTIVNNSLAEHFERERQRLEQSTAFIASCSQDRSTSRRRRRRRDNERTDARQVNVRSSTRHTRDRSPIDRQRNASSSQATRRDQYGRQVRNPPPLLAAEPTPSTLSSSSVASAIPSASSSGVPDHRPQHVGYQIVPQAQASTMANVTNDASLSRPPLPHVQLSQRQISLPVTSNVQLPFPMGPMRNGNATEPVVQLARATNEMHVPSQVLPLPVSHSGSPFHPPTTSSVSHSGIPSLSPQRTLGGPVSIPFQPIAILDSPIQQVGNAAIIVDSPSDREVPQASREMDREMGGALRRAGVAGRRQSHVEVIVVDSSDEDNNDDDVIVSGVSRIPGFTGPPWQDPWGSRQQVSSDEAFARRLQEEFDQELQERFVDSSNQQAVPAVPAGPSIPLPRPRPHSHTHTVDSGSLIRNNYEALVSHVERLTQHDAIRLLTLTRSHGQRRTGRRPRTQEEYARAMESMGDALLFSAIMGPPGIAGTSYEDLLELAETLGPARPQGLPQEVINNFPVREFNGSLDTTTSGELPKCVVCMCEFQEKEKLRTLSCVHEFHQQCIDQWLKDHRTCPICRIELTGQQ